MVLLKGSRRRLHDGRGRSKWVDEPWWYENHPELLTKTRISCLMWLSHLGVYVVADIIYSCSLRHYLVLVQAGNWCTRCWKACLETAKFLLALGLDITLWGQRCFWEALEKHPADHPASFPDRCYLWLSYYMLLESRDLWASFMIYSTRSWSWWLAGLWTLNCFWSLGPAMLCWPGSRTEFSKFCSSGQ